MSRADPARGRPPAALTARYRSPQTNGVVERFFGSLKYEHLYREEIRSGAELAGEITEYLDLYNATPPHEGIGFRRPLDVYLARPGDCVHA